MHWANSAGHGGATAMSRPFDLMGDLRVVGLFGVGGIASFLYYIVVIQKFLLRCTTRLSLQHCLGQRCSEPFAQGLVPIALHTTAATWFGNKGTYALSQQTDKGPSLEMVCFVL